MCGLTPEQQVEKVREEIAVIICPWGHKELYDSCGGCLHYEGNNRCCNPDIDEILSHPDILIRDADQSLPTAINETEESWSRYNQGRSNMVGDMLNDKFVRVI